MAFNIFYMKNVELSYKIHMKNVRLSFLDIILLFGC